jgi:hypothetical protein
MAMSTETASALTRGAKRLKDLATEAISLPSAAELYGRKIGELETAKRRLAEIIRRQIALEQQQPSKRSATLDAIVVEKRAAEELCDRLSHEAGILKAPLIAARPKPPLTPAQKMWADAASVNGKFT